jgi:cold shock CspA family protein
MRRSTGEVANFDDDSGLGLITADDGSTVPFHCVAIVDGTRSVRTGSRVRFRLTQRLGRVEAADIEPLA